MKTLILFLSVSFWQLYAYSQQSNFFLVNLAINENSMLNNNVDAKELLFKKLTELSNKIEGVIIDEYSDYYLVSDIYSTQSQTSNAGFLPVGTYKMNFKLKLIYKSGGKTFKELNFSKDYVVNTESEAARQLINDFSFSETELNNFFSEGSKKMKRFYFLLHVQVSICLKIMKIEEINLNRL